MIPSTAGAAIVAWQTLRTHKLRTFLTCLSLAIAVLALVMVDAASQVAADAVIAEARLTQGLAETWQLNVPAGSIDGESSLRAFEVTNNILQPEGGSAVLVAQANGQLAGSPVTVVAVRGNLRSIRPFPITSGRWLAADESPNFSPEVVLGGWAVGLTVDSGTAQLTIPGFQRAISARIVGTVDDWAHMATIYVRLDDVLLWTDISTSGWTTELLGHTSDERAGEAGTVLGYVASITGLAATPDRIDKLGATADTLATTRTIFLLIAAVALLVGILGILNVGLVSLRERVEEIALRRATGATAVQIGISVLEEAVLAAVVSAAVAVVVSWVLVPFVTVSLFANLPMIQEVGFPYQTAVAGILVAAFAGFAGGIIPAVRAARMDIADVMRA